MERQVASSIARVDDFFDTVAFANIRTEQNELIERFIAYVPVATFFIVGDFDRDGLFVIFTILACPGAICFFNIQCNVTL